MNKVHPALQNLQSRSTIQISILNPPKFLRTVSNSGALSGTNEHYNKGSGFSKEGTTMSKADIEKLKTKYSGETAGPDS